MVKRIFVKKFMIMKLMWNYFNIFFTCCSNAGAINKNWIPDQSNIISFGGWHRFTLHLPSADFIASRWLPGPCLLKNEEIWDLLKSIFSQVFILFLSTFSNQKEIAYWLHFGAYYKLGWHSTLIIDQGGGILLNKRWGLENHLKG